MAAHVNLRLADDKRNEETPCILEKERLLCFFFALFRKIGHSSIRDSSEEYINNGEKSERHAFTNVPFAFLCFRAFHLYMRPIWSNSGRLGCFHFILPRRRRCAGRTWLVMENYRRNTRPVWTTFAFNFAVIKLLIRWKLRDEPDRYRVERMILNCAFHAFFFSRFHPVWRSVWSIFAMKRLAESWKWEIDRIFTSRVVTYNFAVCVQRIKLDFWKVNTLFF